MRWSAIRSASTGSDASTGSAIAPYEQPIEKPSPCSDSAAAAPWTIGLARLAAGLEQRAELVAAHPERVAAAVQEGGQVAAEAHEQRVAGRVAEGVVVVLEAVEVEQREHERALGGGLRQQLVERAGERAAVAEAGQRVGQRLVARRAQHRDVLAEGQRGARHHRDQRGGGEADGERVHVRDRAVDEQAEADRAERRAARRSGAGAPRRGDARGSGRAARRRRRSAPGRPTSRRRTSRRPRRRPAAVRTRYSESASQKVETPSASSIQVRSRRQPVLASAPTARPSRTRSSSG